MSANLSAILIAAVGVFGTLAAAIVSQRLSAHARRDEFEMRKSERLDERQHEHQQVAFATKRACYIALMANARRYRIEIVNYLRRVKAGTVDVTDRGELEAARRAYIASSAEAQLTASLQVLGVMEPFHAGLSNAYRAARFLEAGNPEPGGSFVETEAFLDNLWNQWNEMREAMRHDLGVDD
jgi:hypothetical protein